MFVKCKKCDGKGKKVFNLGQLEMTCGNCNGKGGFEVPEGKKLCEDCDGSGIVLVFMREDGVLPCTCGTCYGNGVIEL